MGRMFQQTASPTRKLEAITVVIGFRNGGSQWGRYLQNMLALQRSSQYVIKEECKSEVIELCTLA
ncbi:hypothetical protein A2U01_0105478, partial [Trifolium medium]|nr:hypothetical protein [Trifolium medium]